MLVLILNFALVIIASCDTNIKDELDEEIGLSAVQLISKNGYPTEVHTILTKDGYLLQVIRIPHGINNKTRNNSAPVLAFSGLFADSSAFVTSGINSSLAYILADQGYDVWLGNNRGTTNCKRHINLDPYKDKKKFWSFSFQEMGSYDLPDTIDYILSKTNKENLYYIGHSQGSTSAFAMLAEKPLYNTKIRFLAALAPVVSTKNLGSPIYPLILKDLSYYISFLRKHQIYDLLPLTENYRKLVKTYCVHNSSLQDVCHQMACTFFDCTLDQTDMNYLPIALYNLPAGASVQQLLHYLQLHQGIFKKFDYGKKINLNKYGSELPPVYNLSNIQVPIAIFHAEKDILSTVKNVEILTPKLSNVVFKKMVQNFKHADLAMAINANKYVFSDIINLMKKF